jgi:hypothetical protein
VCHDTCPENPMIARTLVLVFAAIACSDKDTTDTDREAAG